MMKLSRLALAAAFGPALAAGATHAESPGAATRCEDPEQPARIECGLAPSAAFDAAGRLWVAWALHGHVYLSRSTDKGASFEPPQPVNRVPERIAAEGENRPKLAVGADGRVFVSWTRRLDKPYSGDVRFAVSTDGGRRFSEPTTVNDHREVTSHRFESLAVNDQGEVYLAWLDKRERLAADRAGRDYAGAALYYAVSTDGGLTFSPNRKLADHTCECCRTAMALDPHGAPVVAWRHIFEGRVRDHALVRLGGAAAGRVQRLSFDAWEIDACPHHGPAVDVAQDGSHHAVWFTNGPTRHGLFYARAGRDGTDFSEPVNVGRYDAGAAHADVLSLGSRVYLAWKEFDGERVRALVMRSADGGATWSAPTVLAQADAEADYPFLIADGTRAYLAWHRRGLPYRPIPVPEASP